jgi:hypothetical protein
MRWLTAIEFRSKSRAFIFDSHPERRHDIIFGDNPPVGTGAYSSSTVLLFAASRMVIIAISEESDNIVTSRANRLAKMVA